ncbi:MAG: YggT family protein [Pseudomonadota bacterium]
MSALLDTILLALDMYWFVLIAAAIMSWLMAFNVVNTRNQLVASIWEFLYRITEPVLRPIRKILPDMGGLDISPIIVILAIYFIERLIKSNMHPGGF